MSNIDTAKLFFGVVLNKLQDSFPTAISLSSADLWPEFERVAKGRTLSIKTRERSYQTLQVSDLAENQALQAHYTKLMLSWMKAEGFLVSDPTSGFIYDYVLSSKALAALNIPIEKEKRTIGEALATAARKTGDAAQSELIGLLVERIFDYFPRLTP
ncbi:MAG: hypothetical protein V4583_13900 [Pseudomonadota bacterium]